MQQFLRSIFISIFPLFALFVLLLNGYMTYQEHPRINLIGSSISALTIVAFFAGLFVFKRARTKKGLPVYSILIGLGFAISIISEMLEENMQLIHLIVPPLLVLGWIAYLKWYSVFAKRNKEVLSVGNTLPVFQLENSNKNTISSQSFLGKPAVLLFYRGNWCPLCMAQIKEIAQQYKEIEALGAQVYMISPQPHNYSASLSKKYHLNFEFLVDVDNTVAAQLEILSKHGIPAGFQTLGYDSDTVLPTVIITDKNGEIVFADLTDNYRVRPEPNTFLEVLKTLA